MAFKTKPAGAETAPALPPALRERFFVVDDFLPIELAEAMRLDIDNHFSNPAVHRPETHQVWNYWYVPELYTYLRTNPDKIIDKARVDRLLTRLRAWSADTLGLANIFSPVLSLYVAGCRQNLHNDSANGRFGYVYSLTRDDRKTVGGETIIYHEGDPFRNKRVRPDAGRGFYDLIAPKFNRLVVFDDRLPHAVQLVEGPMDPREGRFVIHGHIRETGPIVVGALSSPAASEPAMQALRDFIAAAPMPLDAYHGPVTLRLDVGADGRVAACRILLDRVIHPNPDDPDWAGLLTDLIGRMRAIRFPSAPGDTHLLLPIIFGQLLP
jgi:Rps23 Pro-64 3,4-dihydroxylase Tpa1-like proline 4-hydroxylase